MPASDLLALIDDARLVLGYAVRAGKLPDNALPEAIDRLVAADGASTPDIVGLQSAMNAAVTEIAPITLIDLRAGRSPFDPRNVSSRKRWQVGLSVATLGLIATIAYYQYLVQQQQSALRAYKEVLEARGSEKITAARKLVQRGNALAEDSCQLDTYQKSRHDLRLLADRTVMTTKTLHDLAEQSPWPIVDAAIGAAQWLEGPVAARAAPPPEAGAPQEINAGAEDKAIKDPCDETERPKLSPPGYPKWLQLVVHDSVDEFCFASKLSVDQMAAVDPIRRPTYYLGPNFEDPVPKVEQRILVQTGWLLPFLYGLLGASVYVMRRLLFDAKAAAVENFVIILRLALGALAGVVIGWFAGPSLVTLVSGSAASSLPYVLAFLAGFSIDNLFTLLDRANRALLGKERGT